MKSLNILNFLLIIACCGFSEVQSLNILGLFPLPAKSHFFVFAPFLKELANRGHNVTVISYYPTKEPVKNYRDIDLRETLQPFEINHPIIKSWYVVFLSLTFLQAFGGPFTCKILLEDDNVQSLLESGTKFDLVIMEQFNSDCGLGIAHKLRAPVMGITSHTLMPWHYERFGVPYNPSYNIFDFLEGGTKPTLYQKVQRSFTYHYINFIFKYVTQFLEQMILAEYYDDIPPLNELAKDIKLVLLYHNFILSGSSILPSNLIEVSGYHVAKPKPLPDELLKFIEESEHGVIYISFGSIIKASTMPADKLQAIISALEELPQRVIWKWNKRSIPGNPKNVYISKWMPQNDILAHPKVLAFFSHCGLLGTTEAIYHGVPIIGLPIFGDQPTNAASLEESGFGVKIALEDLNKENLLQKLKTVLDPKFRQNVKLLSKAWHDRPLNPMDTAVYWTEFTAKHQNFTFRSPSADVPLYQYLNLDVVIVFILFIVVNILVFKYVVFIFIKYIIRSIASRVKRKIKDN